MKGAPDDCVELGIFHGMCVFKNNSLIKNEKFILSIMGWE
ncbi:hypothetical protein PATSB16_21550 [Pandoraea thiooxydans]|nr:hypothetical protein PATSB16_21550 [Pandoraea thiooxydans]